MTPVSARTTRLLAELVEQRIAGDSEALAIGVAGDVYPGAGGAEDNPFDGVGCSGENRIVVINP